MLEDAEYVQNVMTMSTQKVMLKKNQEVVLCPH